RLALQVRGGNLGADRGDAVVDCDQPGAGFGAGRRLPLGLRKGERGVYVVQVDQGGLNQVTWRDRVGPGADARAVVRGDGDQAERFQGAEANPAAGVAGAAGRAGWAGVVAAAGAAVPGRATPAPRSSGR